MGAHGFEAVIGGTHLSECCSGVQAQVESNARPWSVPELGANRKIHWRELTGQGDWSRCR